MKLSSTKHLLCVLAVVITFVFSSCNSENETPVDYNSLPESIAKDFSNRYGANTIKQVCSGNVSTAIRGSRKLMSIVRTRQGTNCLRCM